MGQLNFGPVVKTVAGGMTYCSYLGMFLQAVDYKQCQILYILKWMNTLLQC